MSTTADSLVTKELIREFIRAKDGLNMPSLDPDILVRRTLKSTNIDKEDEESLYRKYFDLRIKRSQQMSGRWKAYTEKLQPPPPAVEEVVEQQPRALIGEELVVTVEPPVAQDPQPHKEEIKEEKEKEHKEVADKKPEAEKENVSKIAKGRQHGYKMKTRPRRFTKPVTPAVDRDTLLQLVDQALATMPKSSAILKKKQESVENESGESQSEGELEHDSETEEEEEKPVVECNKSTEGDHERNSESSDSSDSSESEESSESEVNSESSESEDSSESSESSSSESEEEREFIPNEAPDCIDVKVETTQVFNDPPATVSVNDPPPLQMLRAPPPLRVLRPSPRFSMQETVVPAPVPEAIELENVPALIAIESPKPKPRCARRLVFDSTIESKNQAMQIKAIVEKQEDKEGKKEEKLEVKVQEEVVQDVVAHIHESNPVGSRTSRIIEEADEAMRKANELLAHLRAGRGEQEEYPTPPTPLPSPVHLHLQDSPVHLHVQEFLHGEGEQQEITPPLPLPIPSPVQEKTKKGKRKARKKVSGSRSVLEQEKDEEELTPKIQVLSSDEDDRDFMLSAGVPGYMKHSLTGHKPTSVSGPGYLFKQRAPDDKGKKDDPLVALIDDAIDLDRVD